MFDLDAFLQSRPLLATGLSAFIVGLIYNSLTVWIPRLLVYCWRRIRRLLN